MDITISIKVFLLFIKNDIDSHFEYAILLVITIIIFGGDVMPIKFTKQRQMVFEVVKEANGHVTAEKVYNTLKYRGHHVGVATVYRNLNLLYDEHLINRILHPDVGYLYDVNLSPHYHFHCEMCNQIEDVTDIYQPEMDKMVEDRLHRKVFRHMTTFYGVCESCAQKEKVEDQGSMKSI